MGSSGKEKTKQKKWYYTSAHQPHTPTPHQKLCSEREPKLDHWGSQWHAPVRTSSCNKVGDEELWLIQNTVSTNSGG